jgi:hypothetical protein
MWRIRGRTSPLEIKSIEFEKFLLITNASFDFSPSFFPHLASSSMMQTRARTTRNKVNVRWLPVELIIEIFRRVRALIGRYDFKREPGTSMRLERGYYNNLLAFALSIKEWTPIAQSELFRNIILKTRSQTEQFLKLVTEGKEFRGHAESALSIRFGGWAERPFDAAGLGNDLDQIALYCPNVVEISCYRVDVRVEYFRTPFYPIFF